MSEKQKKIKAVVLLSGGMDSATALYESYALGMDCHAVAFDYGSKHNEREHRCAAEVCDILGVPFTKIQLPFINDLFESDLLKSGGEVPEGHYADETMKRTVVPFRNGIMLSIAVGYAESIGASRVIIGNHFGDHAVYPDCRVNFIGAFNEAAQAGTYEGITIDSPFCFLTKDQIAKRGEELFVPWALTWSCYKGGTKHCGRCSTCVERAEAFSIAEVKDPTEYEDPDFWKTAVSEFRDGGE